MAVNSLVHDVEIDDRMVVETSHDLAHAIRVFTDAAYEDLDETYVVERVKERLSDGSVKHLLRIRLAEPV